MTALETEYLAITKSHNETDNLEITTTIIEAIAETLNINPTKTPLGLNNHIPTRTVNELFRNTNTHDLTLTFTYLHLTITCHSTGLIKIQNKGQHTDSMR